MNGKLCLYLLTIIVTLFYDAMNAQQIAIGRIDMMPDQPSPYHMRNWKQTARGYDSLVFNRNLTGQYLPLIFYKAQSENYPEHGAFGLHTVVGTPHTASGEAINVMPAVIGASLNGIDKTNQDGYNYVLMCENYFNRRPSENIYLNNPAGRSGNDWWYETMPNIFFYQLYSLYPNTGDFKHQFTTVADRFLQAVKAMGGGTAPWTVPNMDYRAFGFASMTPNASGVHEPEAAGAIAWILYNAYSETGNEAYREGAELAMEFLNSLNTNPAYELQLSYGAYAAARMNAELGAGYAIEKIVNWCFDTGPLRGDGGLYKGWGAITGRWGSYDVSGLIGEISQNDYAFTMNGFQQAAALVPMVRYDKRFARAIGKWVLNLANASRLFYSKYLPEENQDSRAWAAQYDPDSYIAYEALRKNISGKTPFATGDAVSGGWGKTNLALYGSSHAGMLAAVLDTTNVPMILRLDVLKTDFFHAPAYQEYLYYNPHGTDKQVEIDAGSGTHDIYDKISETYLLKGVSGKGSIIVPAGQAVLALIAPAGGAVKYENGRMLINDIIADYQASGHASDLPPRIKSLTASSAEISRGSRVNIYCTASGRNGGQLQYSWTPAAGEISGEGSAVSWTAPEAAGDYLIWCIVKDQKGLKDSAAVKVKVSAGLNKAPVIISVTARPGKTDLSGLAELTCVASDPEGSELTWAWKSRAGAVSGTGGTVKWTAPEAEGDYYIICTVSDTAGLTASDSIAVEVRDFSLNPEGKLIAFYAFSGNADDMSGNGLNGKAVNVTRVSDRFGQAGQAYFFDGSTSSITVTNSPLLNFGNAATVDFWLLPAALPDRESFAVSHGSWQNRWKVSITPDKKLRWTVKTTEGVKDLDSKTVLREDSVYNAAAVYTGREMELYINGNLESFVKFSGQIMTSPYDLTIGSMLPGNNSYSFRGVLDDIRIYDYPLLPHEVEALYSGVTDVKNGKQAHLPAEWLLDQNYPNPFNSSTIIRYSLPGDARVSLKVYDILGNEVASLFEGTRPAGTYEAEFRGRAGGRRLASGLYIYTLRAGDLSSSKAMLLMK